MEQPLELDAACLASDAEKLRTRVRVAVIEYQAVTPVMVGDYGGMHYRILAPTGENSTNPKLWITGLPTAKAIIGKARWLSRVLLASAFKLKTHREAEDAVIIKSKNNNKKISLLKALFGGQMKSGSETSMKEGGRDSQSSDQKIKSIKGVISVRLEYESPSMKSLDNIGNIDDINIEKYNKIREAISPEKFYISRNSSNDFFRIDPNKGYTPSSPNRFNVFLAHRNRIYVLENKTNTGKGTPYFSIVPLTRQQTVAHVEPLSPEEIKFKLIIDFDYKRFKELMDYGEEEKEFIKQLVGWMTAVIASVPVILGLGKASSKGFGHFKISDIIELNDQLIDEDSKKIIKEDLRNIDISDESNYFNNIIKLTEKLKRYELFFVAKEKSGNSLLIPIINLKNNMFTCKIGEATSTKDNNILEIINIIAHASLLEEFKNYVKDRKEMHMWFLGIPRGRKQRGYHICRGYDRRQSMVISIPYNNDNELGVLNILFYSEDLYVLALPLKERPKNIRKRNVGMLCHGSKPIIISSLSTYKKILIDNFNIYNNIINNKGGCE